LLEYVNIRNKNIYIPQATMHELLKKKTIKELYEKPVFAF